MDQTPVKEQRTEGRDEDDAGANTDDEKKLAVGKFIADHESGTINCIVEQFVDALAEQSESIASARHFENEEADHHSGDQSGEGGAPDDSLAVVREEIGQAKNGGDSDQWL